MRNLPITQPAEGKTPFGVHHAQQEYLHCLKRGIEFSAHGSGKWFYKFNRHEGYSFDTKEQKATRLEVNTLHWMP